jgi:GNAT superfamily N-acetyltransferase
MRDEPSNTGDSRAVRGWRVREAAQRDYPTLRSIVLAGGELIYREALSLENFVAWSEHTASDGRFDEVRANGRLLVIEDADGAQGTVSLSYELSPWARNHEADATLAGMYVREPGRGVGTQLLAAALEQARSDGRSTLLLSALLSNDAAQRFYARAGFEHVSSHYYNGPVRWAAMRLRLS